MTLTMHFGALCDPIEKQLKAQGYSISEKDNERLQMISDAIIDLKMHGILPDSVVYKSEQKLMKLIVKAESLEKI